MEIERTEVEEEKKGERINGMIKEKMMKGLRQWCNKKLRDLKRRWKICKRRVEWRIKEWVFKVDNVEKVEKMQEEAWLRENDRLKEASR